MQTIPNQAQLAQAKDYSAMLARMTTELRLAAYLEGGAARVIGYADVEAERCADGGRVDRRTAPRVATVAA